MSTWIPLKIADLALDEKDKEIAALKAEVTDLKSTADRFKAECQARQAENSVLAVECDSLKAEVERLKGIILAQSSEFVRNATKQEEEPLPDGWNSSVAKACDLLAEKDKDYARLKAEVERLTKAGDTMLSEWSRGDEKDAQNFLKALVIWNAAKEGKQS